MFSSTSNSKSSSFKTELKVLCMVLLVLLLGEYRMLRFEKVGVLSTRIPTIARNMVAGPGTRVLFLGNSLVREGINPETVQQGLAQQGIAPTRIGRAFMLDSQVSDWYYVFKHDFTDANRLPDVVVICFANAHLEDSGIHSDLIARHHSSSSDIPRLFSKEITSFDGRIQFYLARASASFTYRPEVQMHLLNKIIPYYPQGAMRTMVKLSETASKPTSGPTYRYLRELVALCRSRNIKVVAAAIRLPKFYAIKPSATATLQELKIPLIDGRRTPGFSPQDFADLIHLNPQGAILESRWMARQLAPHLTESRTNSTTSTTGSRHPSTRLAYIIQAGLRISLPTPKAEAANNSFHSRRVRSHRFPA